MPDINMTNDEIEQLEAGRELDMIISGCIFNRKAEWLTDHRDIILNGCAEHEWSSMIVADWAAIPHYSTSISDSWQIIDQMNEDGFTFRFVSSHTRRTSFAEFFNGSDMYFQSLVNEPAPLAICRAALKAVLDA